MRDLLKRWEKLTPQHIFYSPKLKFFYQGDVDNVLLDNAGRVLQSIYLQCRSLGIGVMSGYHLTDEEFFIRLYTKEYMYESVKGYPEFDIEVILTDYLNFLETYLEDTNGE